MRRPKSVLVLVVVLLGFAAFNLLGAANGAQQYIFVSRLWLGVPPAYLIAGDALWAIVFAGLAAGLWFLKGWARRGALIAMPLYFAHGWFDRLVLSRSDYARTPLGWALMWTALWIGLVGGILWREKIRESFRQHGTKLSENDG
jgi:hypothetical protein